MVPSTSLIDKNLSVRRRELYVSNTTRYPIRGKVFAKNYSLKQYSENIIHNEAIFARLLSGKRNRTFKTRVKHRVCLDRFRLTKIMQIYADLITMIVNYVAVMRDPHRLVDKPHKTRILCYRLCLKNIQ